MQKNKAKIISMVPSWTETLLECELNVIGRTRFCIHPQGKVKNIPIVGGTKQLNIEEITKLRPDYVILDREENKLEMAQSLQHAGIEVIDSHVTSIKSAADFLFKLAEIFENKFLYKFAKDYFEIASKKISKDLFWQNSIIKKNAEIDEANLNYVIWRTPFMAIGEGTFIYDVFSLADLQLNCVTGKYPVVDEAKLQSSFNLFSSEPYPFAKDFSDLTRLGYKGALVDGEKISWYGIRNLQFLQQCQN